VLEVRGQPVEVARAHDAAVVFAPARVLAEEPAHVGRDPGDQLVFSALGDQNIIRRDAGLTGVHELRPGDPPRRERHVRVLVDDDRVLPSELESERGQGRGRRRRDLARDGDASGE
jgi:hypothetical protein